MKTSALTFLIIGLVFGVIAVFLGLIKEFNIGTAAGAENQFVHADAAIHACGLIAAAAIVTSGLVAIHSRPK